MNKNTTTPKRFSKIDKLEAGLARSRAAILLSRQNKTNHIEEEEEYIPHGPMYLNATSFHRYVV